MLASSGVHRASDMEEEHASLGMGQSAKYCLWVGPNLQHSAEHYRVTGRAEYNSPPRPPVSIQSDYYHSVSILSNETDWWA